MRFFQFRQLPVFFAALMVFAAPAQAQSAKSEPIRIAFVGDSMADGLWQGVTRHIARNACLKSAIDTERFGKNGTGLTRLDKFNWPREVLSIGQRYKADVYVISTGLNDRNPIYDPDGKNAQIYSKEWPETYRAIVERMAKNATSMKASVIWLGIPALRDTTADKEARAKNAIYAEALKALNDPGVRYVEPWRLKPEGDDVFATYGPDEKGSLIALRAPDGSHFTPAGYDMLGAYLYPKIVETLRQRGIDIGKLCPAKEEPNPGMKPDVTSN
jgi:hypothetical protein